MYNLLLALVIGLVTFGLVTVGLGWVAAIVPAVLVAGVALFLLSRRTGRLVQAEIASVPQLLQARRIDEAETKLVQIKEKYGPWQFLLAGQIDAQLGTIDYLQLKFDSARPKLESGKWRNAMALAFIAAIDFRRGDKDQAWKGFADAAKASSKDPMIYVVWATLLAREGLRTEALKAVNEGLAAIPDNARLKDLKNRIANKQKIETKAFGEAWFQYFPEEYAQQMLVRGTRTPSPLLAQAQQQQQQQQRFGARHAPRR